jgi:hypothetical protein
MRSQRAFLIPLLAAAITFGGAAALAGPAHAAAGSIWTVQPTVNPAARSATPTDSTFASVSASGPGEAWAVGTFLNTKSLDQPLAEHRNATTWSRVPIPEPAGQQAVLSGVKDLGPSNAWAVGTSFSGGSGAVAAGQTLIEHWNGTKWSIVPSPNPAAAPGDSDVLTSISGTGPNDLWAAGFDNNSLADTISLLFEHWNGTTWTAATSPTPLRSAQFANGITAISPDNVWAVGFDETLNSKNLAAHWNGTAWSIVPTPDITHAGNVQDLLTGVSSDAAGDVWASGYAHNVNNQNSFSEPYVLHWTGTTWVLTKVPTLGTEGSRLNGIQVLSPTDAWAAGQTQTSNGEIFSLTEQFNGKTWSVVPSPDPGAIGGNVKEKDNSLDSIASAGGSDLFAVGSRAAPKGQSTNRTLAIATAQG